MLHTTLIAIKIAFITLLAAQCHISFLIVAAIAMVCAIVETLQHIYIRGLPLPFSRRILQKQCNRFENELAVALRRIRYLESENAHLLDQEYRKSKNLNVHVACQSLRHVLENTSLRPVDRSIIEDTLKQLVLLENIGATMTRSKG